MAPRSQTGVWSISNSVDRTRSKENNATGHDSASDYYINRCVTTHTCASRHYSNLELHNATGAAQRNAFCCTLKHQLLIERTVLALPWIVHFVQATSSHLLYFTRATIATAKVHPCYFPWRWMHICDVTVPTNLFPYLSFVQCTACNT